MTSVAAVNIVNDCIELITINLNYPRAMKESRAHRPGQLDIPPKRGINNLPLYLLVGGKDWDKIQKIDCVHIEHTEYEPSFEYFTNMTQEIITLAIKPTKEIPEPRPETLQIDPKKRPRALNRISIDKPARIRKLVQEEKLILTPLRYIGPPTTERGSVGSYLGESVYMCYRCGGPIIFRGSPPRPIHV